MRREYLCIYGFALVFSDLMEYKPIDIAVVDIEMPHFNGMQIAAEIKSRFPECYIIFLTSHIKYAVESYELQIFRYTPKSELETKLPRYLNEALKMLKNQEGSTYTFLKNENRERLPYSQILYVKKDGRYSIITCVDNREIRIRKSLHEIFDELDKHEFMMIERSCIVNIAMITRVSEHHVICKNGASLPISRYKLKETKTKVTLYWGEKI